MIVKILSRAVAEVIYSYL